MLLRGLLAATAVTLLAQAGGRLWPPEALDLQHFGQEGACPAQAQQVDLRKRGGGGGGFPTLATLPPQPSVARVRTQL
jgi:hypothetical protein